MVHLANAIRMAADSYKNLHSAPRLCALWYFWTTGDTSQVFSGVCPAKVRPFSRNRAALRQQSS